MNLEIDANRRTPKYLQIANCITKAIKQGKYKKGDRIFSINELSNECLLSRDTVQKAYGLLEKERIIEAVRGKGFYINRTDIVVPYRILLVFNKISNYKKMIYDSFIKTLGTKAVVDLKIHHSNIKIFDDIITTGLGEFDYLIKCCQAKKLKVGRDVGIISYNETPLKEILLDGITVFSTDHSKMGETAARMILGHRSERLKNPFTLILRNSL